MARTCLCAKVYSHDTQSIYTCLPLHPPVQLFPIAPTHLTVFHYTRFYNLVPFAPTNRQSVENLAAKTAENCIRTTEFPKIAETANKVSSERFVTTMYAMISEKNFLSGPYPP